MARNQGRKIIDEEGQAKKSKRVDGIYIYLSPEEVQKFDEICDYFDITRGLLVRIFTDYIYERRLMDNDISAEELAERHGVGWGTIYDIVGLE